jgi:NIPSNAP
LISDVGTVGDHKSRICPVHEPPCEATLSVAARTVHIVSSDVCCPVLELRQYTLHPGRRAELIQLFDREFVETQEAVGMRVIGQFLDLDDPDRFVWVRGFPDMPARAAALAAFYGGPVWQRHRAAANAAMLDSDDVLLLRPINQRSGFPVPGVASSDAGPVARPPVQAMGSALSVVAATIYFLDEPAVGGFVRFFDKAVRPLLAETGATPIARLETEPAENTYPALPVRSGENVFVWFARFTTSRRHDEHRRRLAQSAAWTAQVLPQLSERLAAPPQQLRLAPTARSLLA